MLTYAIILNYNSAGETLNLYRQLKELSGEDLKILVVDNCSKKEDKSLLKGSIKPEDIVFNEANLGYAGGNNMGIRLAVDAGADNVWLLNPDIRIEPNTLSVLTRTLQVDRNLAAVGPRIIKREAPGTIFSDGELIDTSKNFHTIHKNFNEKVSEQSDILDYNINYLDGSCILLNAKAIKKVGYICEDYFLYFEETDWCTRAIRQGWKLAVNRKARVYNLTSEKKKVYHYYYTRNKLLFSKKFDLNYNALKKREVNTILKELRNRLKGEYLRPYFFSRLKGLISGITQKL